MDKFEQKMDEIGQMSEDERNKAVEDYKSQCICPTCPTYNECAQNANERLFCALGASENCISENDYETCKCPECPLAQALDVGEIYNTYCIKGGELEQREKQHELDVITGGE